VEMSDLPPVRRRTRPFLLVDDRVDIKNECELLAEFSGEGGNA
jgi:hypothetical protein